MLGKRSCDPSDFIKPNQRPQTQPATMPTYHVKVFTLFILLQLTLLSSNNNNKAGLVHGSSSYIDDYFLPTAKIALNKIQQSFLPPATSSEITNTNTNASSLTLATDQNNAETRTRPPPTETKTTGAEPSTSGYSVGQQRASQPSEPQEPNKSEFISLQVRPDGVGGSTWQSVDVSQQQQAKSEPDEQAKESAAATVISSTESLSQDPTTSSRIEPLEDSATETNGQQDPATAATSESPTSTHGNSSPETSSEATTQTESVWTSSSLSSSSPPPPLHIVVNSNNEIISNQISSKSMEDSIRETELEAIAAVDASIGFGDAFSTTTDACYDEYGNARYCEPEFENVAFERQVEVSSECGRPPSRFCTTYLNERNDQIRNCHICDALHPKKQHPASYLTDMNNSNNPTCWVSAPISATSANSNNSTGDQAQPNQMLPRDNVTLALNLDKRYEITYVSMQFCSLKPDSLAIWKSSDFGKTWSPYQFYSSQCARVYERPASNLATTSQVNKETGQIEAICVNGSASSSSSSGVGQSATSARIAFSTLDGARNNSLVAVTNPLVQDKPVALQDWVTATNIKIILDRHQASWIQSSLAHSHHHLSRSSIGNNTISSSPFESLAKQQQPASSSQQQQQQQQQTTNELENSLTNPSDTYNYAMSDLTIGGRCKCNGHASRCVHGLDGKLQCDCQHNTVGPDCERCLPLHHDRPWQRATQTNANPCQPCNCNGHSRKCRFDLELYLLSGKRSGGVCIDCKDNTTGRHCHYCKEGYTRDHSRPMSDKGSCKPCDCHPVGSVGKVCNQTTGQCPCKEGVTGLECNRCAPGYQQSSSPSEPCIRLPENDINYEPVIEAREEQTNSVSHQLSGDQEPGLMAAVGDEQQQPVASSTKAPSVVAAPRQPPPQPMRPTGIDNDLAADPRDTGARGVNQAQSIDQMPPQLEDELDLPHLTHRARQQHQQQQQHEQKRLYQWRQQQHLNRANQFYAGPNSKHIQRQHQFAGQPPPPPTDDMDELEMLRGNGAGPDDYQMNHRQLYGMPSGVNYYPKKRTGGAGGGGYAGLGSRGQQQQQQQARSRDRGRLAPAPMVNLDHDGQDGDGLSQAQDDLGSYGGGGPADLPLSPVYAQSNIDDANFNQIQTGNNLPPHMRRLHLSSLHGHNSNALRARQPQQQTTRMEGTMPVLDQQQTSRQSLPTANSLACADCQSGTKKLTFKQFCHLEYAIRALVLEKQMADDWTRVLVEIQDIFKSPTSSSLLMQRSAKNFISDTIQKSSEPLVENALQSDDPNVLSPANSNSNSNNNKTSQQQAPNEQQTSLSSSPLESQQHPIHRLKIGTHQWIWIPTEDVACKCPRLRLYSAYLVMGLIDTRENSPASIQLDRHGVALEWKASLQEKLIKYQRRHSRGRC